MHLITPESIRDALGYDNLGRINTAISAELDMAEISIRSKIRTTFEQEALTDHFFVVASQRLSQTLRRSSLYMRKGYLSSAVAYTAVTATTMAGLTESSVVNLRSVNGVDLTTFDLVKGILYVDGYDLAGRYVKVTYTAGFAVDGDTNNLYDQSEVPSSLKQLAMLYTKIALASNPALHSEPEEGESLAPTELLKSSFDSIIAINTRYEPLAIKPMM